MPIFAGVKATHIEFVPVPATTAPAGSLFVDSSNANQASLKPTGGGSTTTVSGQDTTSAYFVSDMVAGAAFAAGVPLSKRGDGKVVASDSDGSGTQNQIGYALSASSGDGAHVNVFTNGPRLAGALTGLNFAPGSDVYMSPTSGTYASDTQAFGPNDSIVRLGVADCAAGTFSNTATDLIGFAQVISRA